MKVIRGVLRLCFTVILIALMSIGLLTVLSYISPTAYSFLIEKLDTVSVLEYIPHDLSLPLTDIGLSESDPVSEETSDPVLDTVVSDAEEDGTSDSECPVYDDCSESADPCTCLYFDSLYYPYFSMLDDETLRTVYSILYEGACACEEAICFTDCGIDDDQFRTVWEALLNDHPELFWLNGGCAYTRNDDGTVSAAYPYYYEFPDGIEAAQAAFDEAAEHVLANVFELESDYDVEVYLHDALAEMNTYDADAEYNQSAYSALVCGETVCAGYAKAYQYLMTQCGIPSYYCTGTCGESHAWNIVMLDGEYYNVDLTWDDALSSYAFLNRTDGDLYETHKRTGLSINLPDCSGETYHNSEPLPTQHIPDFNGHGNGGIDANPPDMGGKRH